MKSNGENTKLLCILLWNSNLCSVHTPLFFWGHASRLFKRLRIQLKRKKKSKYRGNPSPNRSCVICVRDEEHITAGTASIKRSHFHQA